MSEYQMPPPNKVNSPQPGNGDEETIDLLELFYALLSKWKQLAAATVACALIAAIGVLFFVTPKYQASSTIYVISQKDSDINMSDLQIGTALTDDYIQVFHMWEVQEKVISNLDLPYTYSQLDKMLSVTNASNTRMVEITVTSESAQEAADIANEYVTVVQDYIAKKMATDKISIMSTALVPTEPVSPNKTKSILLGALLGFVVSAGVIVVITVLDDTYKTAEDIKKYTGLVTMAVIPLEKSDEPKHLLDLHTHVVYGVDDGARTEEQMRAMLDAAAANGITTLVATTHATPGLEEFPQERYQRHLDAAQAYCQQQGYGLRLYPGAELLYNPMLRDAARENGLPTLAGTDWVLMEFLPQTSAKELENGLEEVAVCGYSILMAHVERYRCLESRGLLEKLKARYPVACQMNGSTVLEPGSFWKRRRVERWLSSGVIDVVASDAHNTTSRPVNLREAYQKLKLTFGEETADRLTGRSGLWKEFRDALAQQKTT